MTRSSHEDAPPSFSLARRTLVVGGALVAGSLAAAPHLLAQSTATGTAAAASKFMELSALLIAHHLDADVGARLAIAMTALNPNIAHDIDAILDIAKTKNATVVEDFFPDIPEGGLKATALAIISAWYSGVVVDTPDAEVFAYELALMYQPTKDVMTIPSYAKSGPNGWDTQVPPLSDMPTF